VATTPARSRWGTRGALVRAEWRQFRCMPLARGDSRRDGPSRCRQARTAARVPSQASSGRSPVPDWGRRDSPETRPDGARQCVAPRVHELGEWRSRCRPPGDRRRLDPNMRRPAAEVFPIEARGLPHRGQDDKSPRTRPPGRWYEQSQKPAFWHEPPSCSTVSALCAFLFSVPERRRSPGTLRQIGSWARWRNSPWRRPPRCRALALNGNTGWT